MSNSNEKFNELLDVIDVRVGPPVKPLLLEFLGRVKPRLLTAPASTAVRFHHAYAGGLLDHTVEVIKTAFQFRDFGAGWAQSVPAQDIVLAGLIHDIHKIGDASGTPNWHPNILKSGKQSDAIPYEAHPQRYDFSWVDNAPDLMPSVRQALKIMERNIEDLPEGEMSIGLVAALAPDLFKLLSPEVLFAIRHHDGAYGRARRELQGNETPLMLIIHTADMVSSRMAKWAQPAKV